NHPGSRRNHAAGAGIDRAGPVALLGHAPPGAHRRPRDEYRRGRRIPGRGRNCPASPGSCGGRPLKAVARVEAAPSAAAVVRGGVTRPRILVIEDERALTKVLSYNLEREGYETV